MFFPSDMVLHLASLGTSSNEGGKIRQAADEIWNDWSAWKNASRI